ncbi:3-keto-5-aminohexanoate cleavage protein [Microbacterium sp. NPDC077644]|uniref:3-keto-5-aminohexanoate cleavage protein n=1 Tax=Microbacterium sp. NPDC077644 TaxID=3155055 RepID=UPI00345091BE
MTEQKPVVISAAVTPLRQGVPLQTADEMVGEAFDALEAGAAVIHHHHDYRLSSKDATEQIVDVERRIKDRYPDALLYVDYLDADTSEKRTAYLQPLADAGLLSMYAFDPGYTTFDILDDDGLPSKQMVQGFSFEDSAKLLEFGRRADVPVSIGIYEPGHLRWAAAYARAGLLPRGSQLKLYFPVDRALSGRPRNGVGLYPTPESLDIYLSMIDGLAVEWEVGVPGGNILETPLARYALEKGGHLRSGIEDQGGVNPEVTNREVVEAAVALVAEVGRPVATPSQARDVLSGVIRGS